MRLLAALVLIPLFLTGCVQLQAEHVRAFINPTGHIVLKRRFLPADSNPIFSSDEDSYYRIDTTLAPGETSILVDNESNAWVRPVLVRLDSLHTLPVGSGCTIDTGPVGEPEYDASGYTVVYKLDDLPPYSDRFPSRSTGGMYLHLSPGSYVLFSNMDRGWCRGVRAEIQVTS